MSDEIADDTEAAKASQTSDEVVLHTWLETTSGQFEVRKMGLELAADMLKVTIANGGRVTSERVVKIADQFVKFLLDGTVPPMKEEEEK